MNLGAMIGLGVDFEFLKTELDKLNLKDEFKLECKEVLKCGIKSIKVDVVITKQQMHIRHFNDIKHLIKSSNLSEFVKQKAIAIFQVIAEAEAKVHGTDVESVHFHEVGAIDSIVDVVGAAICFEILGVERIFCSKIELGGGTVNCDHGILNVPVPAVCEIIKGIPVSIGRANFEMTTPTGAAILKTNVTDFCDKFNFNIEKIAYGAGKRDANFANVLRVMLCKKDNNQEFYQKLIQTNIDDMDAESFAFACEELLDAGALDVFSHSIFMKKGRIGLELNVLCRSADLENLKNLIFKHTSTIGVREIDILKTELKRDFINISSKFGNIKVKISEIDQENTKIKPEFDNCKIAARKHNVTLNEVKKEILKNYDKARNFSK